MRKPRADDIRIATEAARWQQLLSGGSASERDRAEFVDWAKASPRHLREFLYAEALEAAASEAGKDLPIDTGLDLSGAEDDVIPLQKTRPPGRRHRRYSRALLAAAAVAATAFGVAPAVIISDTFGRPWREGTTEVAIGVAGLAPLRDFAGVRDPWGYEMRTSVIAVADELASAAELVCGKVAGVPAALIRGYEHGGGEGTGRDLLREPGRDLFR